MFKKIPRSILRQKQTDKRNKVKQQQQQQRTTHITFDWVSLSLGVWHKSKAVKSIIMLTVCRGKLNEQW